jgi:hypothetical protein
MTPIDPVSKAQLTALITYLHDKPCALCRVVYHSHRAIKAQGRATDEIQASIRSDD